MGSTASLLLWGAALVAAVGAMGLWLVLRRPLQTMQRRQRAAALAAAEQVTPARRPSAYGSGPVAPAVVPADPCAPGLSDNERVSAMRQLLRRGDKRGFSHSLTAEHDEALTTTPMAWNPTLPPDEADAVHAQRQARRNVRARDNADHEHITV